MIDQLLGTHLMTANLMITSPDYQSHDDSSPAEHSSDYRSSDDHSPDDLHDFILVVSCGVELEPLHLLCPV